NYSAPLPEILTPHVKWNLRLALIVIRIGESCYAAIDCRAAAAALLAFRARDLRCSGVNFFIRALPAFRAISARRAPLKTLHRASPPNRPNVTGSNFLFGIG